MRLITFSLVGFAAMGGVAMACPSGMLATGAIPYSGATEAPFTALTRSVTAGGDQTLEACGLGILGTGQFRSAPDFSFDMSQMQGRRVIFDVDSDCDPALLINTSDGQWLFNDDTNGLDPQITIEDPAQMSGTVNVWVGTFFGSGCEATLAVENVMADGSLPMPMPDTAMDPVPMPVPVPAPVPMPDMAQGQPAVPAPVPMPMPAPAPAPMPMPMPQQVVCPNPSFTGQPLSFAAMQLTQPQSISGMAMGSDTRVYDCDGVDGGGTATQAPQYTMYLSGMQGYELQLEANGTCDTTLLAYGSDGQWYYNDDGAGDLQPLLTIPAGAANGQVNVWIGTFGGQTCPATLTAQAIALAPPQPVSCPNPAFSGQPLSFSAMQLTQPQSISGMAMGSDTRVYDCDGVDGGGTATQAPQYTMYLSGMQGYELQLEANGTCDTTLLAYGSDGQWYYNDDGAGELQPLLTLPASAANGQVSVWIGTFGGQNCPATLTAQAIALAPPQPVSCPNPAIPGPPLNFTAAQLVQPQAYSIQATGSDTRVADCPGVDGGGSASAMPQTSLYLSGMQGYDLQLEANGSCDTTLLVHGADGQWYYDDDGAGSLQPRLSVPSSALNGRVDVWVGTFGGQTCPATFTLQALQVAPPPVAQGCPNPAFQGQPIYTTGSDLYGPDTFQTMAGGSSPLSDCGVGGFGFANAAPNFTLYLSDMQSYARLEVEVESSCDTTLLIRDAFGQWHFDDDSGGNLMPELNLTNTAALNGRVDVWVGTYGNTSCQASVEFETW